MKEFEIKKNLLHSIVDVGNASLKSFYGSILYRYAMKLLIEKHNALTKTYLRKVILK